MYNRLISKYTIELPPGVRICAFINGKLAVNLIKEIIWVEINPSYLFYGNMLSLFSWVKAGPDGKEKLTINRCVYIKVHMLL